MAKKNQNAAEPTALLPINAGSVIGLNAHLDMNDIVAVGVSRHETAYIDLRDRALARISELRKELDESVAELETRTRKETLASYADRTNDLRAALRAIDPSRDRDIMADATVRYDHEAGALHIAYVICRKLSESRYTTTETIAATAQVQQVPLFKEAHAATLAKLEAAKRAYEFALQKLRSLPAEERKARAIVARHKLLAAGPEGEQVLRTLEAGMNTIALPELP